MTHPKQRDGASRFSLCYKESIYQLGFYALELSSSTAQGLTSEAS